MRGAAARGQGGSGDVLGRSLQLVGNWQTLGVEVGDWPGGKGRTTVPALLDTEAAAARSSRGQILVDGQFCTH